ncbi:MAG TPA: hypothetical protein ENH67_13930 [Pseudoalteromonas sp.]|uniref:Glycosyltransferase RgtA/B/C/D-like domain-containing protein n=1 Tax=marine sediment metagenome TaxID=412755 RepID=A0A0F9TNM7_9ZZZZ|nr:EpsG family protein [Pseudoalteromonas sp.]HDZ33951.1 hypothetical protein [Pseudoalteromonas sp.]
MSININKCNPPIVVSKTAFYFLAALFYGLLLASLPNELFRDRDNYIVYARNFDIIAGQYSALTFFFNEPLFLFYNKLLSFLFAPELVPRVSVFFISSTAAYFILKYARNLLMIVIGFSLLFFVSYTFHLQLVVLRQGVATILFLWIVYFFWGQKSFFPLCFLLLFFHISFAIVFFVLFYEHVLNYFIKNIKLRLLFFSSTLFAVSFLMLTIAALLGVRQATSSHLMNNTNGGGGFVLFAFLLFFLYLRGLNNVCKTPYGKIGLLGVIVYLVFYFTIPVSGRLISIFLLFYYIYIVLSLNLKDLFSALIFLMINVVLWSNAITNESLTGLGVKYLSVF